MESSRDNGVGGVRRGGEDPGVNPTPGLPPACKLDGLGCAIGRRDGVAVENEIGSSRKEVWTADDK